LCWYGRAASAAKLAAEYAASRAEYPEVCPCNKIMGNLGVALADTVRRTGPGRLGVRLIRGSTDYCGDDIQMEVVGIQSLGPFAWSGTSGDDVPCWVNPIQGSVNVELHNV
jgi:hypothetical protein